MLTGLASFALARRLDRLSWLTRYSFGLTSGTTAMHCGEAIIVLSLFSIAAWLWLHRSGWKPMKWNRQKWTAGWIKTQTFPQKNRRRKPVCFENSLKMQRYMDFGTHLSMASSDGKSILLAVRDIQMYFHFSNFYQMRHWLRPCINGESTSNTTLLNKNWWESVLGNYCYECFFRREWQSLLTFTYLNDAQYADEK